MRPHLFALGLLPFLCAAAPAAAQDVAAADALFRRGLGAMEAGRYPEACAALAESQRLDPRAGGLFTLAECRAKQGKIATAVALYEEYLSAFEQLPPADQARQRAREKIAAEKRRELGPRVPRLVLRLPSGVSASVTRDDVTLRPAALGIPLPVDPGEHEVTTQVDRGAPHRQRITIGLDEEKVVDLEVVAPRAEPPPEIPWIPPAPEPRPRRGGGQRPFAFTALGLGVAGVVVGLATGAAVLAKRGTVASDCVDGACTLTGFEAANGAKTLGGASTGGFVVGGLGLVVAGILFLTDRPASASTPAGAPAGASWRPTVGSVDKRGAVVGVRRAW